MPTEIKTVFLHVGCRKSGTSFLQAAFQRAADDLRSAGLEQPLGGRGATLRGLVEPARRGAMGQTAEVDAARATLADLATMIRESPAPRHLISLEAMAELPSAATTLVIQALAEFDTRLVVTARPWALTIPSEWQQRVKSRFTGTYLEYADAVRDPDGVEGALAVEAVDFRHRQDIADVARRWRAADRDLPVHVILVPESRETRPDLTEMFCEVVGVRPDQLDFPDRLVNQSISHEDAEVLRMVNLALGDRLPDERGDYRYSVRKWIAVGTMMKGRARGNIRLPQRLESWASEETARQLADLDSADCQLIGDRGRFVSPSLPGDDFVAPTDADVAKAAAAILADLADDHAQRRRKQVKAKKEAARGQAATDDSTDDSSPRGALGRLLRRR